MQVPGPEAFSTQIHNRPACDSMFWGSAARLLILTGIIPYLQTETPALRNLQNKAFSFLSYPFTSYFFLSYSFTVRDH